MLNNDSQLLEYLTDKIIGKIISDKIKRMFRVQYSIKYEEIEATSYFAQIWLIGKKMQDKGGTWLTTESRCPNSTLWSNISDFHFGSIIFLYYLCLALVSEQLHKMNWEVPFLFYFLEKIVQNCINSLNIQWNSAVKSSGPEYLFLWSF